MASSSSPWDLWMRELNEATRLSDEVSPMIASLPPTPSAGPDAQRLSSSIRRKISILETRLDSLQSDLSKLPSKQPMLLRVLSHSCRFSVLDIFMSTLVKYLIQTLKPRRVQINDDCSISWWSLMILSVEAFALWMLLTSLGFKNIGVANTSPSYCLQDGLEWEFTSLSPLEMIYMMRATHKPQKELNKCKDMLSNLRSKAKQMGSTLNMSNFASREDLLGRSKRSADEIDRTAGLDNHGIVGLQRQVMKEQDQGLEKLEETVSSTKHIALAVNEELDLHTRLIGDLDEEVDSTGSRLQRVQKRLAILNKRTRGGCSCKSLLLLVIAIVILAVVIWLLIKYL